MQAALLAALLLTAAMVQVTVGPAIAAGGAEPNLVLALVVAQAWLRGPAAALWAALAGGLLLDLSAQGPLGVHALALLTAAFTVGWLGGRHLRGQVLLSALAAPPALCAYSAVVLAAAYLLRQPLPTAQVALQLILVGAGLQAMLTPVAALLLGRGRWSVQW